MQSGTAAGGKPSPLLPAEAESREKNRPKSSGATALPQQGVGDIPSTFLCQQFV